MWSARRPPNRVSGPAPRTNDIDTDERRQTIPAARKADHQSEPPSGHGRTGPTNPIRTQPPMGGSAA
jgi:hypothetical protein